MKFNITKDILLKSIQEVQSAISTKSNLPILSNILLEATEDNLILTTTDLDIGLTSKTPSACFSKINSKKMNGKGLLTCCAHKKLIKS